MKYNHSKSFYKKRYKQFVRELRMKGIESPFRNLDSFVSEYEELKEVGVQNIKRQMIYDTQYNTQYKTALAEYKVSKDLGIDISFNKLKKMTTQEFADIHKDSIMKMYDKLIDSGMNSIQAGMYISQYWFGSK